MEQLAYQQSKEKAVPNATPVCRPFRFAFISADAPGASLSAVLSDLRLPAAVLEQGRDGEGFREVLNADVALVSSASISEDEDIGIASFPDVTTGTLGVVTKMPVSVFAALGAVTMVP
uniref:Uncharacterized protein n=1 Tax=Anopheles atroparvus TaxID=41427 RepID=A0A182JDK7_ANOAO